MSERLRQRRGGTGGGEPLKRALGFPSSRSNHKVWGELHGDDTTCSGADRQLRLSGKPRGDFFEALASEVSEEHASSVRTLIEWARPRVKHFSWGEGQSPSCTLVFNTPDGPIQPISIWTGTFDGFSVNFVWVRRRPTPIVEQFLDRLSIIDQIGDLHDDIVAAGYAKRRSVPLDALDDERIAMLMGAIEELIAEPSDQ